MKHLLYPRLAVDGIRKNKKLYAPYIISCTGMVMMYYIICFLRYCNGVRAIRGYEIILEILNLGVGVIAFFSCLFIFYTNSFLIRRRKKEFGLYSILGMGRKHIAAVLLWENLFTAVFCVSVGISAGILFSKIAELGLLNTVQAQIDYSLSLSVSDIFSTVKVFRVIFFLVCLNSIRQIYFSTSISLLRSEQAGEKPPKANWLLGFSGAALLAAAYYIAVSVKEPLSALVYFFLAVIMVIAGTYLIMMAGSVVVCRMLQKNKNYYYKANHFVSVSGMVFRMKRNGAGLASICILATMVLVMVSSTTSLYLGGEDALKRQYPRDIVNEFRYDNIQDIDTRQTDLLKSIINSRLSEKGIKRENVMEYKVCHTYGYLDNDGNMILDVNRVTNVSTDIYDNVFTVELIGLDDYNKATGNSETLSEGQALVGRNRGQYNFDHISFAGGESFSVKGSPDPDFTSGKSSSNITPTITVVVKDLENSIPKLLAMDNVYGDNMLLCSWQYNFDVDTVAGEGSNDAEDEKIGIYMYINDALNNYFNENAPTHTYRYIGCIEESRQGFYSLYGGLFYLGIVLSIVFITATVLIIYYKQISEGYEDRARFDIMQKVGMTKADIRKSVNSQLLMVFFIPMIMAGMHLTFAFPIIKKLLLLFEISNTSLFALTALGSYIVFSLFYTLVYRFTSNTYYNIVSVIR